MEFQDLFPLTRHWLLFMGTSEDSCCSHIQSCCRCAWNKWHLWTCTPVALPTLSSMYHYWWMQFWRIIANITLVKDGFNKNLSFLLSVISPVFIHTFLFNKWLLQCPVSIVKVCTINLEPPVYACKWRLCFQSKSFTQAFFYFRYLDCSNMSK